MDRTAHASAPCYPACAALNRREVTESTAGRTARTKKCAVPGGVEPDEDEGFTDVYVDGVLNLGDTRIVRIAPFNTLGTPVQLI